jgi:serine protease Do
MRNFLFVVLSSSTILSCGWAAQAQNLKLKGNQHWLAVASTKDLNTAIGIARQYPSNASQVVSSESGYYAIVLGPYKGANLIAVKKSDENFPEVPGDALLSDGSRYTGVVWKASADAPSLATYEIDKPVELSSGDVTVSVALEKIDDDKFSTIVSGGEKTGPSFRFTAAPEGEYTDLGSQAGFMKLDAKASLPQIVLTRFSGGAHCCTNTWIVQKPEGGAGWSMIDAGKLDGGGYNFEDVDGDGGQELISIDNRFLYAFDSYAGSFAPIMISKLRDGRIADVNDEPAMQSRLKQDLAGMEFQAKINPDLWKSNGYLAGWVASKMRLGQGDEAWSTVARNFDLNSGFGPQECTTGQTMEDCPVEKLVAIPVLKALADFLKENGYGPLPDAAEKLLH